MDTSSLQPRRLHRYLVQTADPEVAVIATMKIFLLACPRGHRFEVTNRLLRRVSSLTEVECPHCQFWGYRW